MGILIIVVPSQVRILRVQLYYEPNPIHRLFAGVGKVIPSVSDYYLNSIHINLI